MNDELAARQRAISLRLAGRPVKLASNICRWRSAQIDEALQQRASQKQK